MWMLPLYLQVNQKSNDDDGIPIEDNLHELSTPVFWEK